jgi:hypothetical protein
MRSPPGLCQLAGGAYLPIRADGGDAACVCAVDVEGSVADHDGKEVTDRGECAREETLGTTRP